MPATRAVPGATALALHVPRAPRQDAGRRGGRLFLRAHLRGMLRLADAGLGRRAMVSAAEGGRTLANALRRSGCRSSPPPRPGALRLGFAAHEPRGGLGHDVLGCRDAVEPGCVPLACMLRWYDPVSDVRPYHLMNMMLEAKRWVQQRFPYWDRRQGRDHVFLTAHDEGAWCAVRGSEGAGKRLAALAARGWGPAGRQEGFQSWPHQRPRLPAGLCGCVPSSPPPQLRPDRGLRERHHADALGAH